LPGEPDRAIFGLLGSARPPDNEEPMVSLYRESPLRKGRNRRNRLVES
jgi:hypothetical protein